MGMYFQKRASFAFVYLLLFCVFVKSSVVGVEDGESTLWGINANEKCT